jgi:hypothetical protein
MLERPKYLNQIIDFKDSDFIKVLTGVRRSGKSTLLLLYKEYLVQSGVKEENILYFSFEDPFLLSDLLDGKKLYDHVSEKINKSEKFYLLFDEIEVVEEWEKVISGLRVSYNVDITITGSNAKLLAGELATLLSGRTIEIPIYPFSFKEFIQTKENWKKELAEDNGRKLYQEYVRYGGFPAVVLSNEKTKETVLNGIYNTILLHDVAYRAGSQEPVIFDVMARYLADNVGNLISAQKISNTLTSNGLRLKKSRPTIAKYLDIFENAFLFYRADRYDIRGKSMLQREGKYYMVDSGLRHLAVRLKQDNAGNELENIVFMELIRRGYTVDVGKLENKEIDFVARKMDETIYIQVAYEIPENSTRETDNLLQIRENYKKMLIVEYGARQNIDGIDIAPVLDWLMEE